MKRLDLPAGEHPADRRPPFKPLLGPLTPRPQRTAADIVTEVATQDESE